MRESTGSRAACRSRRIGGGGAGVDRSVPGICERVGARVPDVHGRTDNRIVRAAVNVWQRASCSGADARYTGRRALQGVGVTTSHWGARSLEKEQPIVLRSKCNGSGSHKVQEVPPASLTHFGVNGGVIEEGPPISHRI